MLDVLQSNVLIRNHNVALSWSAVLVRELYRCGLRHVVISPGSRSTPLAMAFAGHPGVYKHVILDERSAGFFGLGIGLATGYPAALVCTSGTAVANYTPSVVEAKMSHVPLLVLSADRPPFQRELGANQTIRQAGLFGEHALFSFDTGEPILTQNDLSRLTILADQIWSKSTFEGGPVHINLPFRKPFEPDDDALSELKLFYADENSSYIPFTRTLNQSSWTIPDEVRVEIEKSRRPVVIAPPLSAEHNLGQVTRYFIDQNIPVLAEPGSMRDGNPKDNFPVSGAANFLKSAALRKKFTPDLIIRVGSEPVSKGLELFVQSHQNVRHIRFESGQNWSDACLIGGTRVSVPQNTNLAKTGNLSLSMDPDWRPMWLNQSKQWIELRSQKDRNSNVLTDGDVYRTVLPMLETQHNIMVSNSFPARDADTFGAPEIFRHNVFMNRGASGIDGITSTALGIAQSSDLPVLLFIGDLAYLHDIGGLANHHDLCVRFQVIVIDNNGGSIFRMLPIYKPTDWFTKYFETPQSINLSKLAEAYGYKTSEVNSESGLKAALKKHKNDQKSVIICKTNAEASMTQRSALWEEANLI
jgi:2-succinyl-5-enolpyruvyl-6-hydroxy-3-cyclohexene-1-carboxylate synthase